MPHSHRHLHQAKRGIIGDISSVIGQLNPFKDQPQPAPAPAPPPSQPQPQPQPQPQAQPTNANTGGNGNGNTNDNRPNNNREQPTSVRTVYTTMPPTFDGPIGGYKTLGGDSPQASNGPQAQQAQQAQAPDNSKPNAPKQSQQILQENSPDLKSGVPTAIVKPTDASVPTTLAQATDRPGSSFLAGNNNAVSTGLLSPASASTTGASSGASNNNAAVDDGPSAGAKAGIAFGVLGAIFLVGMIVFFIFNRRKQQAQRDQLEDGGEKTQAGGAGPDHLEPMPTRAPRISLRPMTQLLPNWNMDKRASRTGTSNLAPASAAANVGGNSWDRPSTSASTNPANPFGNQAERVPSPTHDQRPLPGTPGSVSPFDDPMTAHGPVVAGGPAAAAAIAAGAAGAVVGAAALTRKTSIRKDGQAGADYTLNRDLGTVPASPAGTEFSVSSLPPGTHPAPSQSAAAIAAAGGPASSAVHRVQLDFKPTLADEMGLKAGDLVRMLHEYDDGWALCIRLDRSQQGVVPRTCLSTRPVKPRPPPGAQRPGPPVNPQGGYARGPNYNPGRPMTPQGMRPGGPGPRPNSPAGRPASPSGRPQSPNNNTSRRMTPPGPSPMNPAQSPTQAPVARKPIPGQAY